MRWTERLFDPSAEAGGPPPRRLGPFVAWLFAGAWPAVGLLGLVSVGLGVSEALAAWAIGWIVDAAALGPDAFFAAHAWALAALALFFAVLRPGLMMLSSALVSQSLTPGLFHLGVWRLHSHTLGQALGFFENDFTGRLAQKQVQTATAAADAVVELMNSIGFALAAALAALVALGGADPALAGVLAVWLAAYFWLIVRFMPRIRAGSRARADARSALSGQIVDSLGHMATVKLFAHAAREREAARGALGRLRVVALAFGRVSQAFRAWLAVLAGVLPVALVGTALVLWARGDTGPGAIAVAGFLGMRIAQMSGWISFTAMTIFANIGMVEDGMATLAPGHALVDGPDARDPGPVRGAIAYRGVTFGYGRPGGGGLGDFTLEIAAGERVALVGRSGAGKSTALALLLRLHDVEQGAITLDGHDIRGLTQDGLRRSIAMVTQETAMFNRSALDNILYGRPQAGRAAAVQAAREADADGFIMGLADHRGRTGYDAHLGERGVKLSGGQRQRIALARAILKDAPVLVLDEATAALDSETEAAVQAALGRLMRGRTVIAIAHRLSTIAHMDRIVVLDGGRIVEQGGHAQLLARGGAYAGFWARQSGGFLDLAAE